MADASLNLKRKKRGSNSSTSDNELKSPEEKRARDKALNVELALSSEDKVPEHVEMTLDLGAKVDLILSSLDAVNSKLESINAVVVSLEQKLNKVQGRVEMLEQDQAKSKDTIKDMHDGLQALNTIVEASKTASAGDIVKVYCEDKCKDLQDKLLYAEVYQRRENLRFFGIGEKPGSKEDTLAVLQEFFVRVLAIQPEEVLKIEFQRVHRVDKINVDGRPRAIIARFLRYQDREFIFTKTNLLKDSQFGISADLPKEIVKRRKAQVKKLIEARRSGKLAFFSWAEPDKLYIERVLVPV